MAAGNRTEPGKMILWDQRPSAKEEQFNSISIHQTEERKRKSVFNDSLSGQKIKSSYSISMEIRKYKKKVCKLGYELVISLRHERTQILFF